MLRISALKNSGKMENDDLIHDRSIALPQVDKRYITKIKNHTQLSNENINCQCYEKTKNNVFGLTLH